MSLASTLAAGRQVWLNELATDTCRITKPGAPTRGAMDPDTLQYPDEAERVLVYQGPCRFQVKVDINSNVVETTAGDREWTYLTDQLQLPVETPPGALGDVADVDVDHVCEALTAPFDSTLVGAKFNIAGPFRKSQTVYRRLRIREVAG